MRPLPFAPEPVIYDAIDKFFKERERGSLIMRCKRVFALVTAFALSTICEKPNADPI
jgi:hypothetical protein